jgi:MFS family permease
MGPVLISIAPLLAGTALLQLGNGALGTLLALGMSAQGVPTWVIGAVGTAYFSGLIAGTFFAHRLISNVGHIRAYAALGSTFSAATLAHPFLPDPVAWGALRFIEGFCVSGLFMCTESWLNERATNKVRGSIFSIYQITVYSALGSGQFLLNLGSIEGFGLFVVASIMVSLAVVPVAITRVEAPQLPELTRFGFARLYAISPLGVVGCFAAGLVLGAFYGLGPVYAQQIGLDIPATTQFMGITIVGGLLLQWPIGRLSDHFDRRTVMIGLCLATFAVSLAIVFATGRTVVGLLVLGPVFGGVVFTLYPLAVAHANDYIESRHLVSASGGLVIAYSIGAGIGPLLAAALMTVTGPMGLFEFAGAAALGTALFAFWRMQRREAVEDQAPFQAMPKTTPLAAELDPRGEDAPPTVDSDDEAGETGEPAP